MTLNSQLSLTANITATTRSCRNMLNNIRRTRPLLSQEAAQVLQVMVQALVQDLVQALVQALVQDLVQALVQALVISCLDYCPSLLAGLPANCPPTSAAHPETSSSTGLQP